MPLRSRRTRLLLGLAAAVVIAATLVAPVAFRGGSTPSCTTALTFKSLTYGARRISGAGVVQAIAVGDGVTQGCGATPLDVDLRSIAGVQPTRAVAISGDQTVVYVRRGLCGSASAQTLLDCLKR